MNYEQSELEKECRRLFTDKLIIKNNKALYHYTKAEAAALITGSNTFRMTHYKRTNDNQEFLHGMKLAIEVLKECINKDGISMVLYSNFYKFLNREIVNPGMHLYIGCFCERSNNDHLLKKYSCSKQKYLKVELSPLDISNDPLMVKVIYVKDEFLTKAEELFMGYRAYIIKNDSYWSSFPYKQLFLNDLFISILKDVFILSSMYKKTKWSNEEEVRIMNFKPERTNYIELTLLNSNILICP